MAGRRVRREAHLEKVLRSLRADAPRARVGGDRLDWTAIAQEASEPRQSLVAVRRAVHAAPAPGPSRRRLVLAVGAATPLLAILAFAASRGSGERAAVSSATRSVSRTTVRFPPVPPSPTTAPAATSTELATLTAATPVATPSAAPLLVLPLDPDPAGSMRAAVDAARTSAGTGELQRSAALDGCANQLASAIAVDPNERLVDVCAALNYRASSIVELTSTQPADLGPAAAPLAVDEWLADPATSATLRSPSVTDIGVAANVRGDGQMTFTVLLARR